MSTVVEAAAALRRGELAVIPTDTVYGVAAHLDSEGAVQRLFTAKERPREKALPVLAAAAEDLEGIAVPDSRAIELARRWWPGPLTIVLPRHGGFDLDLGGDGKSVAVRVPNLDTTLDLLGRTGPLAVTSANISGGWAAATVAEARAALGHVVSVYLDAGRLEGRPSTIVSLVGETKILREGEIPFAEIVDALADARP